MSYSRLSQLSKHDFHFKFKFLTSELLFSKPLNWSVNCNRVLRYNSNLNAAIDYYKIRHIILVYYFCQTPPYVWEYCHCNHCFTIKVSNSNILLLRDTIVAGLTRYLIVWNKYFVSLNAMNLGTGGDLFENMFWRAISLPLQSPVQKIVVHCETNISTDSPRDIFDCIVDLVTIFRRKASQQHYMWFNSA